MTDFLGCAIWGLCVTPQGEESGNEGLVTLGEDGAVVSWKENSREIAQEKLKIKQKAIVQVCESHLREKYLLE